MARRAVPVAATEDGAVDFAPEEEQVAETGDKTGKQPPELVVCASGNLGLIYFPRLPGRVSLEQIDKTWPGLVEGTDQPPRRGRDHGPFTRAGRGGAGQRRRALPGDDQVEGVDPLAQYGEHALTGMRRVDGMANCPDLVAISLLDPATDEVAAFEELIGSHGGLGGAQTEPVHPAPGGVDHRRADRRRRSRLPADPASGCRALASSLARTAVSRPRQSRSRLPPGSITQTRVVGANSATAVANWRAGWSGISRRMPIG